jgi:hypothetical protein
LDVPSHILRAAAQSIDAIQFSTYGLCGGMALSAWDCFAHGVEIPRSLPMPPQGSPLYGYVFDRQMKSLELMGSEFVWQITGTASHHGRWSRGALNGSDFNALKRSVDNNKPIPIGLMNRYAGSLLRLKTTTKSWGLAMISSVRIEKMFAFTFTTQTTRTRW